MQVRLANAQYAPPVSRRLLVARFVLAAVFTVLLLAQLFAFEKMGTVIEGLAPTVSHGGAKLIATCMVLLELAAIPSLLVVALSPLARVASRLAGPFSMVGWYILVFSGVLTARIPNSGLFGSEVIVPANIWTLVFIVIIFGAIVAVHYIDVKSQPVKK